MQMCIFSFPPVVVNFISFWFSFQIWIRISSHRFSFHLPQLSSALSPFFCLWYSLHFPPSPFPFAFLHTCYHCQWQCGLQFHCPRGTRVRISRSRVPGIERERNHSGLQWAPGQWITRIHIPLLTHRWACVHTRPGTNQAPRAELEGASLARGCHQTSQGSWRAFR